MKINNVAYSWSMVELSASGLTANNPTILNGVSALKWEITRNIKTNHGAKGKPVSRGFGNTEYTASITMDYNTQVQLRAGLGSLMELGEFDLVVSFANEMGSDNWTTETVTLKQCFFSEDGMESSADDTSIEKEFNLNPFEIIPMKV